MELLEQIKEIILPYINEHQCYLDDIVYEQEKNEWYLRIYIDKNDEPLDMETCVAVSEAISATLDEHDLIKREYYLEVSSPGAEKELKTFEAIKHSIGKYIYVKLKDPKQGMHEVYGHLVSIEGNDIQVEYKDKGRKKSFVVDYDNISLIRLASEF